MARETVDLPKYSAMTVTGDRVTSAQASEVIIRTTDWLQQGCNDRAWEEVVWGAIGARVIETNGYRRANFHSLEAARERLRGLRLNYLYNSRVMSSWVGGPHGWCDWSGDIHSTYNIGKCPSVEQVGAEWSAIAEAFPFLRLRCQLWSGETSEVGIRPLVEFVVGKGKVRVTTPKKSLLCPSNQPYIWLERGCTEEVLRLAIQHTLGI